MVQIVLIRPGSTDYDEEGRIQGTLDIPLNEHGSREVEEIIRNVQTLGIETIYCGPCQSACQTASALADALDLKLKKIDALRNIDQGLWQGLLVEEVKRKQPKVFRQWQEQPEMICPPEGEMLSEAQERVEGALSKLLKKHRDGTIALVAPEPLASIVHALLTDGQPGALWKAESACGKWEIITPAPETLAHSQS